MTSTPLAKRDFCRNSVRPVPSGARLLALLGVLASGACAVQSNQPPRAPGTTLNSDGPNTVEPTAVDAPAPNQVPSRGPAWTLAEEQAGAVTDGVAITSVRAESADGIQRLHIDFDGQGPPPFTKLEKADSANKLWLTLSGVRRVSPDLPLLTGEGGTKLGDPVSTGQTPLVGYGRVFLGDDSAVRIELTLDAVRPHRLLSSESPRRLTLELQR
jgi:hypothetical protein